jgi:beta-lactamase class A
VLLVSAILNRSETQPTLLQEKLFFTEKEIKAAGYAPITQNHIQNGMTILELCAVAIMYSDNGAANLLIKKLGGLNQVNAFAQSIGDNTFRLDRFEPELNTAIPSDLRDTTTPIIMAKDLEKLLLGNALAPYQQKLLKTWLEHNATGDLRIRASVPKDWIVADKTGTGEYGTTNDIAILW